MNNATKYTVCSYVSAHYNSSSYTVSLCVEEVAIYFTLVVHQGWGTSGLQAAYKMIWYDLWGNS